MNGMLAITFAVPLIAWWCLKAVCGVLWWFVITLLAECGRIWRIAQGNVAKGLEAQSDAHGDAAEASEEELAEGEHFDRKGWLVGSVTYRKWFVRGRWCPFFRKVRKLIYTHYEASGIGIAGKGQGKTQTGIAQLKDIALRPEKDDVVIVDPAGDLRLGAEAAFRANGYRVRVIDFEDTKNSDWHDPITFLDTEDPSSLERRIGQMVELMLPDDGQQQANEHFQDFPRLMVQGVLAYMVENEKQSLTLYNLVRKLTANKEERDELLKNMAASSEPLVLQGVTAYNEAGTKERGSFGTTMARKLRFCLLHGVRALTEKDEFHEGGVRERGWSWEDIYLGTEPTVVFIVTGLGMSHKLKGEFDVARILLGTAINARRNVYGMLRNRIGSGRVRFNRGLRLFVDEAKKIGNCQAIMDANDELRKAQTTTMLYFLTSRDIFNTYPQATTLIENSDLMIFGGSKEKSWMEDISWMVGEKTMANIGGSTADDDERENFTEQARRVKKSDEIRRMKRSKLLYVNSFLAVECDKPYETNKDGVTHIHGS